jgi:tetratricopeptide (TPR) repeat protein
MAKQRTKARAKSLATKSRRSSGERSGSRQARRAPTTSASASKPWRPPQRSTYIEAVALYERGIEAVQRHDYKGAVGLLESVLEQFPDERELVERARLYLNVCARQAATAEDTPTTSDERLYAATLALNGGRPSDALKHLRLVRDEDPDNDHALYMLAIAHAQQGEHLEAIAHLARAIALNPESRALARRDQDFDSLRDNEAFQAAVGSAASGRGERKRSTRPKTGR